MKAHRYKSTLQKQQKSNSLENMRSHQEFWFTSPHMRLPYPGNICVKITFDEPGWISNHQSYVYNPKIRAMRLFTAPAQLFSLLKKITKGIKDEVHVH